MKLRVGLARVGRQTGKGEWENRAPEASESRKRFLIAARTCCTTGAELQRFQLGMRRSKY